MKILVFYTPRSKSTALHNALASAYRLEPWCDMVTQSRIRNKNFNEYPALFERINSTDNICVKLNGNDFINLTNNEIVQQYKDINYNSFDKIFFITRNNIVDAIASYAYMNPADKSTWHKPRGEYRVGTSYMIPTQKIFYMLRGYVAYNIIKDYICNQVSADKIYDFEYESVEQEVKNKFDVDMLDIDIEPNGYNYSQMAPNYNEIAQIATEVYQIMATYDLERTLDKHSFFWKQSL